MPDTLIDIAYLSIASPARGRGRPASGAGRVKAL